MTLERKDCRVKLDDEMHQALLILAEIDGMLPGEWAERVVCRAIRERVHAASLIADMAQRRGISGISREDPSGFTPLDTIA